MSRYVLGTRVRLSAKVYRLPGNKLVDPDTLVLRVRQAQSGEVVIYGVDTGEVARTDVGRYFCDVDPMTPGTYWYRWEATGNVVVAGEGNFVVLASKVT